MLKFRRLILQMEGINEKKETCGPSHPFHLKNQKSIRSIAAFLLKFLQMSTMSGVFLAPEILKESEKKLLKIEFLT